MSDDSHDIANSSHKNNQSHIIFPEDILPQSPSERISLAKNKETATELLELLSLTENEEILQAIAGNPNASLRVLMGIFQKSRDKFEKIIADNILKHKNPKEFEDFFKSCSYPLAEKLVDNKDTPFEVLEFFYQREFHSLVRKIASHPNTPDVALDRFLSSNDMHVIRAVSRNPNTSHQTLEKIYKEYRQYFPTNLPKPGASVDNITELGQDIAVAILRHENTPKYIIEEMELLNKIRSEARTTRDPQAITELSHSNDLTTLQNLANNPATPQDIIRSLIKSEYYLFPFIVKNPNCPQDLLYDLYREVKNDPNRRGELVCFIDNLTLPLEILVELINADLPIQFFQNIFERSDASDSEFLWLMANTRSYNIARAAITRMTDIKSLRDLQLTADDRIQPLILTCLENLESNVETIPWELPSHACILEPKLTHKSKN